MQQLVLISGQQGSGKTTTQKALVAAWNLKLDQKAISINFADPLYEMHFAVLDVAKKYGIKTKGPKDGPLLQVLGTDWGRNTMSQDIWVDCLKGKMEVLKVREGMFAYARPLFVIGDCRFKNEFDLFPDALRVRLNCSEHVRKERIGLSWRENTSHASETDLDGYAEDLMFDLAFDTAVTPPATIIEVILMALHSNNWKRNRT